MRPLWLGALLSLTLLFSANAAVYEYDWAAYPNAILSPGEDWNANNYPNNNEPNTYSEGYIRINVDDSDPSIIAIEDWWFAQGKLSDPDRGIYHRLIGYYANPSVVDEELTPMRIELDAGHQISFIEGFFHVGGSYVTVDWDGIPGGASDVQLAASHYISFSDIHHVITTSDPVGDWKLRGASVPETGATFPLLMLSALVLLLAPRLRGRLAAGRI